MRFALVALMLLALSGFARADEPALVTPKTLDELDARLAKAFTDGHTPGATIAVIEDNKIVWHKNYGARDVGSKEPVTDQTVFRAGSINKTFTALLAMTYVAEGKLDLNARLADIAPEIGFDNPWEKTDPVRLVHLLEHTTGWRDLSFSDLIKPTDVDSVGGALASSRRLRVSRWQPGRYMAYSNLGPGVMGIILERVGGAPYATLMRDRVLTPLGMTGADFALTPANRALLSKSYDRDGVSEISYHGIGFAAAGTLLTTSTELANLVMFMNARGVTAQGRQLVSPETIARMEYPQSTLAAKAGLELGYGLGVFYAPQTNFIVFGHNGGIDGFESAYVYWPAVRKGYVMMSNGGTGMDDALEAVTLYLGRDYKTAVPAEVKVDPASFTPYVGYYRAIAPRHPFLAALMDLYPRAVSIEANGRVNAMEAERVATSQVLFRRAERAEPSLIFYTTPEGAHEMSTGREAFRALTWPELIARAALIIGAGLTVLGAVLLVLIRIGRLFFRGRERPATGFVGAVMRWAPMLSLLAFFVMLGTFLFTANAGYQAVELLGRPDAATYTIYYASLAWPALATLGLLAALFAPAGVGFLSRATAFVMAASMSGLALFFYLHGWVGIQFWE